MWSLFLSASSWNQGPIFSSITKKFEWQSYHPCKNEKLDRLLPFYENYHTLYWLSVLKSVPQIIRHWWDVNNSLEKCGEPRAEKLRVEIDISPPPPKFRQCGWCVRQGVPNLVSFLIMKWKLHHWQLMNMLNSINWNNLLIMINIIFYKLMKLMKR